MKKNIKMTIAYQGTSYGGWQKNRSKITIEEALTTALETVLQHRVKLQAASRTDSGVHARGQVVNFFTDKEIPLSRIQHSLSTLLQADIAIKQIEIEKDSFHPTIDALKKEYRYQICNGAIQLPFLRNTSWHFPYPLSLDLMRQGSLALIGTHDFSTFCNERSLWDRNPICHLEKIEVEPLQGNRIEITLLGDHFLYKMVRNLVGTLAYIGCKKLPLEDLPLILSSKKRILAGMTAPAHGLTLERVEYPPS